MCVRACVYISVCVYVFVCACACVGEKKSVCVRVCVYMFVRLSACVPDVVSFIQYSRVIANIHVCIYVYMYITSVCISS